MRYHGNFSVDIPDDELLSSIILERRKELFFRGTRWADLRRLNKENHFAVDLVRIVDGKRHILKPNTSRYLWPIPNNVVELSDVFQNPR
ncbi:RagB/SusD family nutrient uptake outer membrane protein [Sphingobacterium sp. KU25419]|nr:RagB/SusD family nutrient uptake outer membrane protein [Sphingobacterium sp. KU25419]